MGNGGKPVSRVRIEELSKNSAANNWEDPGEVTLSLFRAQFSRSIKPFI